MPLIQICRVCGCDDFHACVDPETGETCFWAAENLCSVCADTVTLIEESLERGDMEPGAAEPQPLLYGPHGEVLRWSTPQDMESVELLEPQDVGGGQCELF